MVLFKFIGKVMTPAGDKLHVFCRQFAKLDSLEAEAGDKGYIVATLSDYTEHVYATVAEYTAAAKAAAEAAAKVAEEVKDATMMEGDMMMDKMEGEADEMMGDGM